MSDSTVLKPTEEAFAGLDDEELDDEPKAPSCSVCMRSSVSMISATRDSSYPRNTCPYPSTDFEGATWSAWRTQSASSILLSPAMSF
jgi:hypothetical protein